MKKFIILFSALLFIALPVMLEAQNKATYDKVMNDGGLFEYRGKAVDTVGIGKTTFTYTFYVDTKEAMGSYYEIALDSVSGTAASTTIAFQSRKNIFTTWTTDSTDYWAGTTSDSTIVYYDTSQTVDPYRRIKVTYGSAFKVKIDWLSALFIKD